MRTQDPDSKAGQIVSFFERNPTEWLTWDDLILKFDLGDKSKAREILSYIRRKRGVEIECATVLKMKEPT